MSITKDAPGASVEWNRSPAERREIEFDLKTRPQAHSPLANRSPCHRPNQAGTWVELLKPVNICVKDRVLREDRDVEITSHAFS
jgi:hypothetical protein